MGLQRQGYERAYCSKAVAWMVSLKLIVPNVKHSLADICSKRCTLEVLGYTPGSLLPTAHAISFYFPRDNPSTMGMVEARLPGSFKAVSRVEFKIDGVEQPVMLYLDDVRYTVYNVTNMEGGIGNVVHQEVVSRKEGAQKALKREVPFKA